MPIIGHFQMYITLASSWLLITNVWPNSKRRLCWRIRRTLRLFGRVRWQRRKRGRLTGAAAPRRLSQPRAPTQACWCGRGRPGSRTAARLLWAVTRRGPRFYGILAGELAALYGAVSSHCPTPCLQRARYSCSPTNRKLMKIQGWALRSFPFGTLRYFPF